MDLPADGPGTAGAPPGWEPASRHTEHRDLNGEGDAIIIAPQRECKISSDFRVKFPK